MRTRISSTFSSLKARRLGFRIASGVRYPASVDLDVKCRRCGRSLEVKRRRGMYICRRCGVPAHPPEHFWTYAARVEATKRSEEIGDVAENAQRIERRQRRRAKVLARRSDWLLLVILPIGLLLMAMLVAMVILA